jgi:hypothetical protein
MKETQISNILFGLGADHAEILIYMAVLMGKDTVKQIANERGMAEAFTGVKIRKMVGDGLLYLSKHGSEEIVHAENPGTLKERFDQLQAQKGDDKSEVESIEIEG